MTGHVGKASLWSILVGRGLAAVTGFADELDYVGSDRCADCHTAEAAAWAESHHALAWTEVGAPHMAGDFGGTAFSHDGTLTEFYVDQDAPTIRVTQPDGTRDTWPVHSVVGIAPLQQYLLETDTERLQSFDVVWDVDNRNWYHLYPDQLLRPGDGLHWSGPYKNWNARCATCHATGYAKAYDPITDTYASTQAEIGVGCEACHGPGSAHVDWATDPEQAVDQTTRADVRLTFDPSDDGEPLIQLCASCHSRREAFDDINPLPGTAFADAYRLAVLRAGAYHADGQILDEVYVYGSFLQSRMYAKGVTCLDCHDPHRATRIAEGNALCTQCHNPAGNPRFPSLRLTDYDTPTHHHHPAGSDGALCVSCHMIERTYMGIDGRRDHSFRVPRPDLAERLGTPDACTDCHADRSAAWAQATLEGWFPDSPYRGSHFGDTLAAGRSDPQAAREGLLTLAADRSEPGIVRATALSLLAPIADPNLADRGAGHLDDADPLVREHAVALQFGAPPSVRVERLAPMLRDPHKSVRIAAARTLLDLSPQSLPAQVARDLQRALAEWQTVIRANFDFPETQMVMGGIGLTLRNMRGAEAAFARAVEMDPQLISAWSMRVRLAEASGDPARARAVLDDALRANPDDPQLHFLRDQFFGPDGN